MKLRHKILVLLIFVFILLLSLTLVVLSLFFSNTLIELNTSLRQLLILSLAAILILAVIIGFTIILVKSGFSTERNYLKQIEDYLLKLKKGELHGNLPPPPDKNLEFGSLHTIYNELKSLQLNTHTPAEHEDVLTSLNKKITEQTAYLQNQQKAILNVLEDVEIEKINTEAEKEKINTILHSIGDAVVVIDNTYEIIIINKVAAKLLGYKEESVLGKNFKKIFTFLNETTGQSDISFIQNCFARGTVQNMGQHIVLIDKNKKKIPVDDSCAPIKNSQGKTIACIVVFRDVTEQRNVDKAKTEFVSIASHQMRTPLSTVNWYTEMLLNGDLGTLSKDQLEYVNIIHTVNQRLIDLVNALLNVSRIELGNLAIEPEPCNFLEISDSVLEEMFILIKRKEIKLTKKYDKNIPLINADPKFIRILFQNILSNAIKYTPAKGAISLIIEKQPQDILIKISDTGYGIPEKDHPKIFSKLFRADNIKPKETEGTGLGLYIVKAIVDYAQGKIWFTSQENKGTTFYISIPIRGMQLKPGTKTFS